MNLTFSASLFLAITMCTIAQAQIGGDVNSISPEHRAEFLRRQQQQQGGVGVAERIVNGQLQRFVNGQWQTVTFKPGIPTPNPNPSVGVAERIYNGVRQQYINGRWQDVQSPIVQPSMPNPSSCPLGGQWRCSCGATWNLNQNGYQLTGNEYDSRENNSVSGTWSGREFIFRYIKQDGMVGHGVLTADGSGRRATGRILWSNGTSSNPTLTRF